MIVWAMYSMEKRRRVENIAEVQNFESLRLRRSHQNKYKKIMPHSIDP